MKLGRFWRAVPEFGAQSKGSEPYGNARIVRLGVAKTVATTDSYRVILSDTVSQEFNVYAVWYLVRLGEK